ncbi:hypothetical protein D3C80_1791010 [compost metagenome]
MRIVLRMCWIDRANSKIISSMLNSKLGLTYRMCGYSKNAIADSVSNFGSIVVILSDMDSIRIDLQSQIHIIIDDEGYSCSPT